MCHPDELWDKGCVPDVGLLSGLLFGLLSGLTGSPLVVHLICKKHTNTMSDHFMPGVITTPSQYIYINSCAAVYCIESTQQKSFLMLRMTQTLGFAGSCKNPWS